MSLIKKNLYKLLLLAFLILIPIISFADEGEGSFPPEPSGTFPSDPNAGKLINPISVDSIQELIKTLLEGVLKIGIPIVALAIIYCGFLFVAARGNAEKITKAKSALLYTLIGATILLGSWAIAELLRNTVLELALAL